MKRQLSFTTAAIDEPALVAQRQMSAGMGAAVSFTGVVRGREGDSPITAIDYEAFQEMASHQFDLLFDQMERRWPGVESVRLVHRLGIVPVNEPSLWLEIVAPHRGAALAAGHWLIDEMKRVVPIWKRPITA